MTRPAVAAPAHRPPSPDWKAVSAVEAGGDVSVPCPFVHTVTWEPGVAEAGTLARSVCVEPSGSLQRTVPHARALLVGRAEPCAASWVRTADTGRLCSRTR